MKIKEELQSKRAEFIAAKGTEPNYACCVIQFQDDNTIMTVNISLNGAEDDSIFYSCDYFEGLLSLTHSGYEDFTIINLVEFYNL